MGPRPDGRGKPRNAHVATLHQVASMGPRPDGRGKYGMRFSEAVNEEASMGPRPDGRGKLAGGTTPFTQNHSVNGAAARRPRKVAGFGRMRLFGKGGVNGAAARRPRKGRIVRITITPSQTASMGPRPDGRGKFGLASRHATRRRASMGPRPDGRGKRRRAEQYAPAYGSVNGAAARRPRKGQTQHRLPR